MPLVKATQYKGTPEWRVCTIWVAPSWPFIHSVPISSSLTVMGKKLKDSRCVGLFITQLLKKEKGKKIEQLKFCGTFVLFAVLLGLKFFDISGFFDRPSYSFINILTRNNMDPSKKNYIILWTTKFQLIVLVGPFPSYFQLYKHSFLNIFWYLTKEVPHKQKHLGK